MRNNDHGLRIWLTAALLGLAVACGGNEQTSQPSGTISRCAVFVTEVCLDADEPIAVSIQRSMHRLFDHLGDGLATLDTAVGIDLNLHHCSSLRLLVTKQAASDWLRRHSCQPT